MGYETSSKLSTGHVPSTKHEALIMTHTKYGTPYWLHRFPRNRQPDYPRVWGEVEADAVIVGGGLTGCLTAYAFGVAGVGAVLVEAGRIGHGSTASSAGVVLPEAAPDFAVLRERHGLRAARQMWLMSRRAALDFAALVRRLHVRCDLAMSDTMTFAVTPESGRRLQQEYQALREADIEASWLTRARLQQETGIAGSGGIRGHGAAHVDPYRALVAVARAADRRGVAIYERTPVRRVRATRQGVEVTTGTGTIRAKTVVLATLFPTPELKPLRRHFTVLHRYAVLTPPLSAALRRQTGHRPIVLREGAGGGHVLAWTSDDRILFAGAEQPRVPDRSRDRALVQRTGQLMYELSLLYPAISGIQPEYGWDTLVANTVDGAMYAGPHRNYPHHLFALGYLHNGLGQAWLAARIVLRHYLRAPDKGDELFAFSRNL